MLDITFESRCWKENPSAALITVTHPLAKIAADYLQSKGKVVTILRVTTDRFAAGEYPFAIYQWKLSGEREDLQMVPVSANTNLNNILFELLKQSYGINYVMDAREEKWEAVEATHHSFWMSALKEHKYKTEEMISYKEASLRTSHAARMGALQDALRNNSGKKAYVQMMNGKIRIAQEDYDIHMAQLQKAKDSADILFELLAYGMLVVEQTNAAVPNDTMLEVIQRIASEYGKEIAPEQATERRKLKLLFDIGAVDILNEGGPSREERVISMASHELGYEEAETRKLIQYLEAFY